MKSIEFDSDTAANLVIHDRMMNGDNLDNLKFIITYGFKGVVNMTDEELMQKVVDSYEHEIREDESVSDFINRKKNEIPNYLD